MNSNKYFSQAPIAKEWKRSVFPITYRETSNYTSFNLGDIVPLYKPIEVIAHDTFIFDVGSLIRTISAFSTAIMDDIDFDVYAFYCPKRLLWDSTFTFYGQGDSTNIIPTEVTMPRVDIRYFQSITVAGTGNTYTVSDYQKTVASHLGIPMVDITDAQISSNNCDLVNILPLRMYWEIVNWYFRDENLQTSYNVIKSGNGDVSVASLSGNVNLSNNKVLAGATGGLQQFLAKACKKHDYFTSMLPFATKSATPVKIPIQGVAPLTIGTAYTIADANSSGQNTILLESVRVNDSSNVAIGYTNGTGTTTAALKSNLYADLANATATNIQLIREALALYRLLEVDALGGTRYDEQIYAHFGARPNALSFKPELLGEAHFKLNVDQVLSHAGTSDESLGDVGAYSLTGNNSHIVSKSFQEPGYIMILGVARQATHIYSQGLDPLWSRSRRYDEFYPEFANFGLVPAYRREIMAGVQNTNVFGYKEYGSEHRYFTPMVTGILNPNITGSLDYYTLADELPANVALSSTFIQEDDSNLKRALLLPNQDQFVARFGLQGKMVRVVPVHSVPKGLI